MPPNPQQPSPMNDVMPPNPYAAPAQPAPVSQPMQQFAQPTAVPVNDMGAPQPVSIPVVPAATPAPQPMAPAPMANTFSAPPASAPMPAAPAAPTQIVQDIPVRAPHMAQPTAPSMNMPSSMPATPTYANQPDDSHMDSLLQDVNQKVGTTEADKSKSKLAAVNPANNAKVAAAKKSLSKPVLPLGVAVLIFVALSVMAFMVMGRGGTKQNLPAVHLVGTSAASSDTIQAGGGSLVSTSEIDDFSKTVNSKINGMNDAQDFDQSPLSNEKLGL
jgi:hypothetical protein